MGQPQTKTILKSKHSIRKLFHSPPRNWTLPSVLKEKDLSLYGQIFKLQEKGDWATAKNLIKKLNNPLLMGHVNAQKYLHPTKYRSKYVELLQWMRKYADHPQAKRIYSLALRRRPPNWKSPRSLPAKDCGGVEPFRKVRLNLGWLN